MQEKLRRVFVILEEQDGGALVSIGKKKAFLLTSKLHPEPLNQADLEVSFILQKDIRSICYSPPTSA